MKLFKEWFKTPESAQGMSKSELADQQRKAQEEAHQLEKIARMNLRGKNEDHLDALDPEMQAWIIANYPKTNDDSLASDYAYSFIVDGYEALERDEQHDAEMQKTIQSMFETITKQYQELGKQEEKVRSLQKKLYDYQQSQRQLSQVLQAKQAQAFAAADEYYSHADAEVLDTTGAFEASIKQEIDEQAEILYQKNRAYRDAYDRWQALTRQDEASLDRFATNN